MRRDLGFGLLWAVGLYAFDAGTSVWELKKSLSRVSHDSEAAPIVRQEVLIYLGQVLLAYALVGVVVGLAVWLLGRALPQSRLWHRRLGLAGGLTLWIYARGAILWPLMHNGIPGLDWWAAHVDPGQVTGVFLLAGALWVGLQARRALQPGWLVAALALLGLLGLADHQPAAAAPRKNRGPNVLLVGFDALRPDHLQSFGYARDTAPRLDAFLDRSVVYTSAFTPEARTWEAWASILTGTWPLTHGMRWNLPAPGEEVPPVAMLPQVLQKAGWYTSFLTDDSRFSYMLPEHGFTHIDQPMINIRAFAPSRYQPNFRLYFSLLNGPPGWTLAPVYRYNQAYSITHRVDAFAEHIAEAIADAATHDRFFMAVHVCLLHTPADRPYPYHRLYGMTEYSGDNRYRYRSYGSAQADGDGGSKVAEQERRAADRQQNINLYDAGLVAVDDTWARIEAALEAGGLLDNTIVVVLSDHGEDFLEDSTRYRYTGPNHGFHAWGLGQHRVLLGVHEPGAAPARKDELVSLIDLAPTLARTLGLDLPDAEGRPLQDPPPAERILYTETGVSEPMYWSKGHVSTGLKVSRRYAVDPETHRVYQRPEFDLPTLEAKDRGAFDDEYWLVQEAMRWGYQYSLFRWREDPTFARDVLQDHPEAARRLHAALSARERIPGRPEPKDDPLDPPPPYQIPDREGLLP